MSESKPDRLGLRGTLGLLESALRLLGGANATGAITSGAAFHAFAQNIDVQSSVKAAAVLFLFGLFCFVIGYGLWFATTLDIDRSLRDEKPVWPDDLFWQQPTIETTKSAEEYRTTAKRTLVLLMFAGLASFVCFIVGLGFILAMTVKL